MNKKEFGILTFESTQHAIKAESDLVKAEIKTKTIPTPRDITLSCGLAIRVDLDDIDKIKELYDNGDLKFKNLYTIRESTEGRFLKKLL
ncbi:MAG: DUF3343 domain-containing protein [Gudongella sp.]|nr:DUF3343 domain-containing protein [Gudongella sp.]